MRHDDEVGPSGDGPLRGGEVEDRPGSDQQLRGVEPAGELRDRVERAGSVQRYLEGMHAAADQRSRDGLLSARRQASSDGDDPTG